jgi:sortase A
MRAEVRRHWLWIERVLLAIGIACSAWWAVVSVQATRYQFQRRAAFERLRSAPPAVVNAPAVLPAGAVIGSLEIPRLHMSAVIAEGDDDATLRVAIGHLRDTPLPWHDGNSAVAGHRDTFFRPLQHIRVGDQLRLSTLHGDFRYEVRDIRLVGPNDVWVLDRTRRPTLTLITCYPFSYVGKAPRRFIVKAERIATAEPKPTSKNLKTGQTQNA